MRYIAELVDQIDDEIESGKDYAESYLKIRAEHGDDGMAKKYKSMSEDEIRHAMYLHEYAQSKIEELKQMYTPPTEMQEAWNRSHGKYIEKVAWIKQMLAL